jgi:hypothetical protein
VGFSDEETERMKSRPEAKGWTRLDSDAARGRLAPHARVIDDAWAVLAVAQQSWTSKDGQVRDRASARASAKSLSCASNARSRAIGRGIPMAAAPLKRPLEPKIEMSRRGCSG